MQTMERQIIGAVLIVLLINLLYISRGLLDTRHGTEAPILSQQKRGYRAVELTGPADLRGVYFVPPETSLADLLDQLHWDNRRGLSPSLLNKVLYAGDVLAIPEEKSETTLVLQRDAMSNQKRHVLDMPMNVNTVRLDDLMLVPGIGEKTAEAILKTREELGGFEQLDDLLQVRGIGEKKLETYRKYLYAAKNDRKAVQ